MLETVRNSHFYHPHSLSPLFPTRSLSPSLDGSNTSLLLSCVTDQEQQHEARAATTLSFSLWMCSGSLANSLSFSSSPSHILLSYPWAGGKVRPVDGEKGRWSGRGRWCRKREEVKRKSTTRKRRISSSSRRTGRPGRSTGVHNVHRLLRSTAWSTAEGEWSTARSTDWHCLTLG